MYKIDKFDLILMDILCPMDGMRATKEIGL
jgi:CheY-like chemotaxis protein